MANIIITITVNSDAEVSVSKNPAQPEADKFTEFMNTPLKPTIPTDEEIAEQLLGKKARKRKSYRGKYASAESDEALIKTVLDDSVGKRYIYVNDRVREALSNILSSSPNVGDGDE